MASVFKFTLARRKPSARGKRALARAAWLALIQEIEELEQQAHRLGFTVTARALNNAKNAAGWEMAGDPHLASKAARGG